MKRFQEHNDRGPLLLMGSLLLSALCITCALLLSARSSATWEKPPFTCTVMCYMNGDNDLNDKVLHAVDMMETVGSSERLNILALVDGGQNSQHGYGKIWKTTRLLHITKDDHIGAINSPVLRELGEQDLGNPQTLEYFIGACLISPPTGMSFVLLPMAKASSRRILWKYRPDTNHLPSLRTRPAKG